MLSTALIKSVCILAITGLVIFILITIISFVNFVFNGEEVCKEYHYKVVKDIISKDWENKIVCDKE